MKTLRFERSQMPLLEYGISKLPLTVGRGTDCDIVLLDEEISRKHCKVDEIEGQLVLIDLQSRNGIFYKGQKVSSAPLEAETSPSIASWNICVQNDVQREQEKTVYLATPTLLGADTNSQPSSSSCRWILEAKDAEGNTSHLFLSEKTYIIGQDKNCDVCLNDPYLSRKHCSIVVKQNSLEVKDLESTNGTKINGISIRKSVITSKTQIELGKSSISLKPRDEKMHHPIALKSFGRLLGESQSMKLLYKLIRKVAPSEASVCIEGETGTGKEVLAKTIHEESKRSDKVFLALNCGAIPENLIESILFGHERGAFTGASERRAGVFEQANGGTLFLDEIAEMPLELQTRLLRVLEERVTRRIGGKEDIPVDVRIITATHQDLKHLVERGKFRTDLYYRLYILPLHLPPLRARKEDVALLAEHFLRVLSPEQPKTLSSAALAVLTKHSWPGNVRELKHTLERSALFCEHNVLDASDILLAPAAEGKLRPLREQEKERILELCRKYHGNQSRIAEELGMARTTLISKLKSYQIESSEFKVN